MSNPRVLVQPFKKKDLAVVLRLDKLSFALKPCSGAWFKKQAQAQPESFLVAEINGKVVGYALGRAMGQRAKINRFALAPQHRQEIGQQLIAQLINHFRKRGVKKIEVEVRASNQASIRLLKSFHFQTKKTSTDQEKAEVYLAELSL